MIEEQERRKLEFLYHTEFESLLKVKLELKVGPRLRTSYFRVQIPLMLQLGNPVKPVSTKIPSSAILPPRRIEIRQIT